MDRMLVAVFDNEAKAERGKTALLELDRKGDITLWGCAVVLKHADGTASLIESADVTALDALAGSALGSFIALLGGPSGVAPSAFDSITDLENSRVGADFIDEIAAVLLPNKAGVVAELDEESTERVDAAVEAFGGIVCRRSLMREGWESVQHEIEAMQTDLAQLKAERECERAERKAKLQENIDQLEARILAKLEESDRRQEAAEKQDRIKRAVLRKNLLATGRAIRDLMNTPV